MFAVIRIRGSHLLNGKVRDTLDMLRLDNANSCVVIPETPDFKGMLHMCKDYVTWGEVDSKTLAGMMEKRMRAFGTEGRVDAKVLKEMGFDSFEKLADSVMSGATKLSKQDKVRPVFRLSPPSGGFKSVNNHFPQGDTGYRGRDINSLIGRMM